MDVEELFKKQFSQMRKEDQAKYFLMHVESVKFSSNHRDTFKAIGTRVDNGQPVFVISTKSSSGQHLPEKGGILRADKVQREPSQGNSQITGYRAQYFHAYRPDSLCVQAVIQAPPPKYVSSSNMWSAQVHAVDVDTNVQMVNASTLLSDFEKRLCSLLKPWAAEKQSPITHDVKGAPLWDGQNASPGFAPFVVVRFAGQSFKVYGTAAVKEGSGDDMTYRLPTDQEIMARVQSNPHVHNLKVIAQQAPAEELAKLPITLIPGLSISVGRESLAGSEQKYLAIPEAFTWVNRDKLDEKGNATSHPGYRMAFVHIKQSRTGRMMVTDVAPTPGGYLSKNVPETSLERELRLKREQAQTTQQASPAPQDASKQAPSPSRTPRTEAPAAAAAAAAVPAPAALDFDDRVPNGFDDHIDDEDFAQYASDMAAIESMNEGMDFGADSDEEELLAAAAARQAERRSRPRM